MSEYLVRVVADSVSLDLDLPDPDVDDSLPDFNFFLFFFDLAFFSVYLHETKKSGFGNLS
jgi:hypothetical protein